ncbi:MAG: hypothetical protein HYS62_02740 [Candidatus Aenigmarchaeota archaeon]|nr:hypothetical protein [Candidatus Aenigmarchaeota archaeon]
MTGETPDFKTVILRAYARLSSHQDRRNGRAYIVGDYGYVELVCEAGSVRVPQIKEIPYGDWTRREFVQHAIGQGNCLGFLPASPASNNELIKNFKMEQNDIGFLEPKVNTH